MQATKSSRPDSHRGGVTHRRRKRRTAEELRARLINSTRDEVGRRGVTGATTAAIARGADVTETQLFRYFPSKESLIREAVFAPLASHFLDFQNSQADDGTSREAARSYISELRQFLTDQKGLLLALLVARSHGGPEGLGTAMDSLDAYFERGAAIMQERSRDQAKVDPRLMVRVSFAAMLGAVLFQDSLFPDGLATSADIDSAIEDFMLDGLGANPDAAD